MVVLFERPVKLSLVGDMCSARILGPTGSRCARFFVLVCSQHDY